MGVLRAAALAGSSFSLFFFGGVLRVVFRVSVSCLAGWACVGRAVLLVLPPRSCRSFRSARRPLGSPSFGRSAVPSWVRSVGLPAVSLVAGRSCLGAVAVGRLRCPRWSAVAAVGVGCARRRCPLVGCRSLVLGVRRSAGLKPAIKNTHSILIHNNSNYNIKRRMYHES